MDVTSQTGVPIDPVFNVKSVRYMLTEMQLHPERFKGTRILYIHSGMFQCEQILLYSMWYFYGL